jgi:hypothetical protein
MANRKYKGFGLRQTMTVGNTPATGGQSELQNQIRPRCWYLQK